LVPSSVVPSSTELGTYQAQLSLVGGWGWGGGGGGGGGGGLFLGKCAGS